MFGMGMYRRILERVPAGPHILLVALVAAAAVVFPPAISSARASMEPQSQLPIVTTAVDTHVAAVSGHVVTDLVADAVQASASHGANPPALRRHAAKRVVRARAAVHEPTTTTSTTSQAPVAGTPAAQPPASSAPSGYGCAYALSYLAAHAAPGFAFQCPGYAAGHQAMTCINVAGLCPGAKLIAIAVPCAAAYMNEASNSWVLTGKSDAPIDPYGYCPE